jgi:hypothetical protein
MRLLFDYELTEIRGEAQSILKAGQESESTLRSFGAESDYEDIKITHITRITSMVRNDIASRLSLHLKIIKFIMATQCNPTVSRVVPSRHRLASTFCEIPWFCLSCPNLQFDAFLLKYCRLTAAVN